MERFISAAVGTFYIIISFFLVYKYLSLRLMLGFMLMPAVMLVFFLAILMPQKFKLNRLFKKFKFLKRMESKFNDFRDSFIKFKDKKKYIALSFAANMFSQFLFIACYYFANLYAGINLNFLSFLFLNPIIILSANIPVSIGGIGVRENIAVLLLKQFGVAEADAVVFTLVILAIIILNAFIGGAVHILKNLFYKPGSKNS